MDFETAVREWRLIYAKRRELEDLSDRLKRREKELQGIIIEHMITNNHKAVRLEGLGVVTKLYKTHYRIQEGEKFYRYMFEKMKAIEEHNKTLGPDAGAGHIPLSDAILLQKTALKSGIEQILDTKEFTNADEREKFARDELGVEPIYEPGLSFKK